MRPGRSDGSAVSLAEQQLDPWVHISPWNWKGVLRDPQFVPAEPLSTTDNVWLSNLSANLFISSTRKTQIIVMCREIHHRLKRNAPQRITLDRLLQRRVDLIQPVRVRRQVHN